MALNWFHVQSTVVQSCHDSGEAAIQHCRAAAAAATPGRRMEAKQCHMLRDGASRGSADYGGLTLAGD